MAKPTIETFARDIETSLGTRLVSLLLYGSAARGQHVPERSDYNTLLICDAVDEDLFVRLEAPVRGWVRAGQPAPLILTEPEWHAAADAFPLEYADMRDANRLLAGRDPWNGITVRREHVRRQLEHEVMGKLVHVRQAYAALRGEPKRLTAMIVETAGGFFAMLRGALRLAGATPPATPRELVRAAGTTLGFDAAALEPLAAHAAGVETLKLHAGDPLPAAYVTALASTAAYVNRLEREGQ